MAMSGAGWGILYLIVYKRCSESVGCVVVEGGRRVMYTIENHLFHPAKGAPQKRDDLHRKRGTLLVPFLRCPPSILMGNDGGRVEKMVFYSVHNSAPAHYYNTPDTFTTLFVHYKV